MSSDRKLYILCGGESRRMGRDKALIEVDGKSLLEQQVKKGELFFNEVILLCGQNIYQMENRQLPDKMEDTGPLAGMLEALKDGVGHSMSQIAIIPVDLPFLSESTLKKLSKTEPRKTDDAIILKSGENPQPLAGVYNTDLVGKLNSYLYTGNRMVFGFMNQLKYSVIQVEESELKNLNKPGDLGT